MLSYNLQASNIIVGSPPLCCKRFRFMAYLLFIVSIMPVLNADHTKL